MTDPTPAPSARDELDALLDKLHSAERELAGVRARVEQLEGVVYDLRTNADFCQAVTDDERAMLHAIIADCHALIDPEAHPELKERIDAVLLPCDEAEARHVLSASPAPAPEPAKPCCPIRKRRHHE